MAATPYSIYDIQLCDLHRGQNIGGGGKVLVIAAGGTSKVALYDPDNAWASLANPVTPSNGKIRFATLATVTQVDLYGMDGAGRFFVRTGMKPGAEPEILMDADDYEQNLICPFDPADYVAATEFNTGFVFPAGSLLRPQVAVNVTTVESGKTINVGLLSSESGGSASGIINGVSLATAGIVRPTLASTQGAFLLEAFATTPAVNVPTTKPIVSTSVAKTLTYTVSSGAAAAKGFIQIPYIRPFA